MFLSDCLLCFVVYFPASGQRSLEVGVLVNAGASVRSYASSPCGIGELIFRGGSAFFGLLYVYPQYTGCRSEGFPVRCVQELMHVSYIKKYKVLF